MPAKAQIEYVKGIESYRIYIRDGSNYAFFRARRLKFCKTTESIDLYDAEERYIGMIDIKWLTNN